MNNKEYVQGDAYIASRNWKPIVCNWCKDTTTTSIRVPSLGLYLSWCESCQKVPNSSWFIPKNKIISNNNISVYDSTVNEYYFTGCTLKEANHNALDELKKVKHETLVGDISYFETSYETDGNYSKYLQENLSIDSWLESIAVDNTDLLSSILDLNYILGKVLLKINDQEREILILIIHRYQLDNYLTKNIKDRLYQEFDLDSTDNVKITQQGVAEFLGYLDNTSFRKYRYYVGSLVKKTREVLLNSGFKREIDGMDKNPEKIISCLRGLEK